MTNIEETLLNNSRHLVRRGNGYQVYTGPVPPENAISGEEMRVLAANGDIPGFAVQDEKGNAVSPVPFFYWDAAEKSRIAKNVG